MQNRVILIDPSDSSREVLARRLRAQGYAVDDTPDPASGADLALRTPPTAIVAELWMKGISGMQLCQLLRAEPATSDVAIILVGDDDEPKNRFWADRAGADAYVPKRRTGEIVRAIARSARAAREDDFFLQLSDGEVDVRDRIASQLDRALIESVIAAEVRALASAGSFERLFDRLAQFVSQVARYRWLALTTDGPSRFALHHAVGEGELAEAEARAALGFGDAPISVGIEDEDASKVTRAGAPIVAEVRFDAERIARLAMSPVSAVQQDARLVQIVGGELGGPLRMTTLVEESQRLAATDPLTGLMNRRSMTNALGLEVARSLRHGHPLSLLLVDVDHFKAINDRHGHKTGDLVLSALGRLLTGDSVRRTDLAGRWGGEEFLVVFTHTSADGARIAAERVRRAVERLEPTGADGAPIALTISAGLTELAPGDTLDELVDRADRAMYESKTSGRNRISIIGAPRRREETSPPPAASEIIAAE